MARNQQTLFEVEPPAWEVDDAAQQFVATVVLADGPPGEFDYVVPDGLQNPDVPQLLVEPGRRVRVPLGRANRAMIGYCVAVGYKPTSGWRLKPIAAVLDSQPLMSPAVLRLTRWMADYYLCPLGQVLETVVPSGVRQQAGTRAVALLSVPPHVKAQLAELKLPKKQAEALQILATSAQPQSARELAARAGCTVGPIQALRTRGLVVETIGRVATREDDQAIYAQQQPHSLTDDQQKALDTLRTALESGEHHGFLIHGVTGSGKTEVYIRAIEEVVSFGRQAIVLVPEISLTPQTVGRFRARFERVAVLHSHQTDVERHQHWQRIARGEVQVVVGARSAVFAPTPHLGLIIIDEEHEPSFKQDTAPRYHARDVAQWRARETNVPLILASATPSLESWQRTQEGVFVLIEMPRRVLNRPMPAVKTIDLREDSNTKHFRGAISRPLHQAMEAALRDGGQVILLLNRRGYSTHIQCPACGFAMKCPHCDVSLVFHRQDGSAACHYCDYHVASPKDCPDCHSPRLRFSGLGTQRLEAEVHARFPKYECLRMDTDSTRRRGSHEEVLGQFRDGKAHILLGTQMIAKGLDFPNVTLVGVVNADTALHLPDFRAAERTFQLVTQVAGRTGRGPQGGRVLVQTLSPEHPAIQAAITHDYVKFARAELTIREALGYPPFSSLVRVLVRGPVEVTAEAFADQLGDRLRKAGDGVEAEIRVLGPAPATIPKLRDEFRFQIQLHATDGEALRELVRSNSIHWKAPDDVTWIIDVDPLEML